MAIPFQQTFLTILERQLEFLQDKVPYIGFDKVFCDVYAKYHPSDSALWSQLWGLAVNHPDSNIELASAINIARAGGAILQKSKTYNYMIKPDYDNKHCTWTKESYSEIQQVFRENEMVLLEILKRIGA